MNRLHSSPSWSSESKPPQYNRSASGSFFIFSQHPSSSDPEERPNSLLGEISGFTSLLSVFTTGLLGVILPPEMDPLLLFSFCCLLYFSQRELRQVSFLPVSLNFTPPFFFTYTLYGETVLIFVESGLEVLATLVPCF